MEEKPKINVLLLESDPGDAEVLCELLTAANYNVFSASEYDESVEIIENNPVGVVVADVSTGSHKGMSAVRKLSESFNRLPWVVLTTFDAQEMDVQRLRMPSRYLLFKHRVNEESLQEAIMQAVGHRDLLDQLEHSKESLVASENRFRTIIERNADVIVIFDKQSNIRYINPSGKFLFGEDGGKLLPQIREFPIISGQGMMFSDEDDEGRQRHWDVRVVVIDWTGELCFLGTIRDVTDWKNAEHEFRKAFVQLERSNKDLETFAYVASHDLQEPLRTVSSFLGLLQRRFSEQLNDQAKHYISRAVKATLRMQEMILSLLDYSRLTTQTQAFKLKSVEEALDLALENLEGAISSSGAVIERDKLPDAWCEQNQIARLLQNLIGNAIKFSDKDNPRIEIRVSKIEDKIYRFSVSDNGIGIESQFIPRIFVVFQRLNRENYPGTGIGLAMCKKIVEYHGGRIWVESEPGKGSTFYFTLRAESRKGGIE
ncbi:MAG: PAS domain S-box protein [Victivallales bacterium]|nr:PAS domain S-box protein [Victivallales bacterium]